MTSIAVESINAANGEICQIESATIICEEKPSTVIIGRLVESILENMVFVSQLEKVINIPEKVNGFFLN